MNEIVILVDGIIALTLIELAVLAWLHRRYQRGISLNEMGLNIASGLALMVTIRMILTGGPQWGILLCLLSAGLFHGLDMVRRWRR